LETCRHGRPTASPSSGRDGRDWRLETGLAAQALKERDAHWQQFGLIPADIAGYLSKEGARYAALWRRADKGEKAVLYAGVPAEKHRAKTDAFKNEGYVPATVQGWTGADGVVCYSGVWWKGEGEPSGWNLLWDSDEPSHSDLAFAGERLLLDVHVGHLAVSRRYASVWRDDPTREAVGLHGLSAEAHLARCHKLAAQGYRPVALVGFAGEKAPVAASVWHRPVPAEAEQARRARRQAMAGATLLHLGQAQAVWPLFRHRPDPTVRSYLVRAAGMLGVDPWLLVDRLGKEADVSARRALILALGEYRAKELPAGVRGPLVKKLLAWYRYDPDAGIHGAIDWLLRHAKEGSVARALDWGQRKELERIDRELTKASRERQPSQKGKRGWYVNGQGQTFALIKGPVEFRMGSPPWEPDRIAANEKPHVRGIGRSYAIATKPVTVAQWQRFLKDRPDVPRDYRERYSPEPGGPIIAVSWYAAAQYCNWLSEKEGLLKKEWCYPDHKDIKEGMKPFPDYLMRTGYRLPSEAEWEYACRAGAASSRYYGCSVELLPRHGFFKGNSRARTWPVGQKRPNDLGLFDMHGNVWNWCQETALLFPSGRIQDNEDIRYTSDKFNRVLRGAPFSYLAPDVRSAVRDFNRPAYRYNFIGLRVARTYR
jgi:formylglycine-generating enzyme required for sulfatase activity